MSSLYVRAVQKKVGWPAWPRARTSAARTLSTRETNWTATVNGKPAVVSPGNYAFRSVQVPAWVSRVVFEYLPAPLFWGAIISAVALSIMVAVWTID